jgi:hypothetical protein
LLPARHLAAPCAHLLGDLGARLGVGVLVEAGGRGGVELAHPAQRAGLRVLDPAGEAAAPLAGALLAQVLVQVGVLPLHHLGRECPRLLHTRAPPHSQSQGGNARPPVVCRGQHTARDTTEIGGAPLGRLLVPGWPPYKLLQGAAPRLHSCCQNAVLTNLERCSVGVDLRAAGEGMVAYRETA